MDGFNTLVLTYQDATGEIFTSRIISNNPDLSAHLRDLRLKEMYKAWGYDLLSVCTIDELHHEIAEPYRSPRLAVAIANGYRIMMAVCAIAVLVDLGLSINDHTYFASRLDRLEAHIEGRSPTVAAAPVRTPVFGTLGFDSTNQE